MATRPAGSGVLVTLVVFVLTTVAFMVAFVVVLGQSSAAIDDLQKIKDTNKNLNSQLATAKKDAEALAATQTELTTDRVICEPWFSGSRDLCELWKYVNHKSKFTEK